MMVEYSANVEVNKTIEEAWELYMDESRMVEWLAGFKRVENIDGEPLTVGNRRRMLFENLGREVVLVETVRVNDPPREYSFDLNHETMNRTKSVTFESIGTDKTRIVFRTYTSSPKLRYRTMMRLMVPYMKKRQREDLLRLKSMIEAS